MGLRGKQVRAELQRFFSRAATFLAQRGSSPMPRHQMPEPHPAHDQRTHELQAQLAALTQANERLRAELDQRQQESHTLQRQNRYLAALHETTLGLMGRHELSDLLERIIARAGELLDTPHGYIYLVNPEEAVIERKIGTGVFQQRIGDRIRADEGLSGKIWQTGKPLVVNDYDNWEGRAPNFAYNLVHAIMGVPLISNQQVVGVLGMAYPMASYRSFGAEEVELLSRFAQLASLALDNAWLFAGLQRERQRLLLANEVGRVLATKVNIEHVLDSALQLAPRLKATQGYAVLLGPGTRHSFRSTIPTWDNLAKADADALINRITSQGLEKWVLETRQPALITDTLTDSRWYTLEENKRLDTIRSVVAVPLFGRSAGISGVLAYTHTLPDYFDQLDLELIELIGHYVATAIDNAILFEETTTARRQAEARAEQLAALNRVTAAVSSVLDMQDMLKMLAKEVVNVFQARNSGIALLNEEGTHLTVAADYSLNPEEPSAVGIVIPMEGNLSSIKVVETKQTVLIEDPQTSYLTAPIHAILRDRNTQCLMIVPLLSRGEVIGTIGIDTDEPERVFTPPEVVLAESIGAQIASAIENGRLFAQTQAALAERERAEVALQEAAEEAQAANRAKSAFLAAMSHELRTPLNSIINFTGFVLDEIFGPVTSEQSKYLRLSLNSSEHLLGLINDILDLSKIEAGKMELFREQVDLSELFKGVMSTATGLIKNKPLTLRLDIPDQLPSLRADQTRVRQILLNLLSNAAKFTTEGEITLRATATENEVLVSISDTGIGIAPEHQEEVFAEFQQVDNSNSRRAEGTGLGLAICRRLVEMHGGRMWLESELGVGSTFWFALPLQEKDAEDEKPLALSNNIGPGKGPVVLVVDDDDAVHEIMRHHLEPQGYRVVPHLSGVGAIEIARDLQPILIILDILMPHKDGWQVLHELKASAETANIPVVVCTAIQEQGLAYHLGADDYIAKPVRREPLLNIAKRVARGYALAVVIDDDPNFTDIVAQHLAQANGFRVIRAMNGEEGWDIILREHPDLVVLDLVMPEVGGLEVLQRIRNTAETRDLPVIVVTAKDLSVEEREDLNAKAHALFQKGRYSAVEFAEHVLELLQERAESS